MGKLSLRLEETAQVCKPEILIALLSTHYPVPFWWGQVQEAQFPRAQRICFMLKGGMPFLTAGGRILTQANINNKDY